MGWYFQWRLFPSMLVAKKNVVPHDKLLEMYIYGFLCTGVCLFLKSRNWALWGSHQLVEFVARHKVCEWTPVCLSVFVTTE